MKRLTFLKTTTAGSLSLMLPGLVFKWQSLEKGIDAQFANPPKISRPHVFWFWMNGNISKEGIDRDLEAMNEAGIGGCLNMNVTSGIPEGPIQYDGDEWHSMMTHALHKADDLDMKICSYNCAGWSSGGGPWITPETSMKKVVWSAQQVQGPNPKYNDLLEKPETEYDYYRDIAVVAFSTPEKEKANSGGQGFRLESWKAKTGNEDGWITIRPKPDTRTAPSEEIIQQDQIVNLSDKMNEYGQLTWEIPDGNWTILRFGYTTTGVEVHPAPSGGNGLECDKLSKEATTFHWNQMVQRIMNDAGSLTGDSLYSIEIDSYEQGPQNWTQKFAEEFKNRQGYEILNYLPCLTGRIVVSVETSERFLWDFRRTIADLFTENYYGTFAGLCHENDLNFSIEPYGSSGFFDDFAIAAQADIPMGEFWTHQYSQWTWPTSKLAASAGHANGRKLIGAEAFTTGRENANFANSPYSLKTLGDYFYCQGINHIIFHTYAHHPWPDFKPGMTMGPWGIQMNRGNTWFKRSGWFTYMARCQFFLQEGQFIADIGYFCGENVKNTLDRREELQPVPPKGYDYDAFSTDVLMQFEVDNGRLVLPSGMQYRLLVLPDSERTMRTGILQKIHDLVNEGATIVGPRPQKSPSLANYPKCDDHIKKMADKVWGKIDGQQVTHNNVGNGQAFWGEPLEQVLARLDIPPDFAYSGADNADIQYIHRRIDGKDVYFVSNQAQHYVNAECSFRATGNPEKWDPETGYHEPVALYRRKNGKTTIPVLLKPAESLFFIFDNERSSKHHVTEAHYQNKNILEANTQGQKKVEIVEAQLGILHNEDDVSRTMDVSQEVAARVINGQLDIIPCRHILSDPVPDIADNQKQLFIKYMLDGQPGTKTVDFEDRIVIPSQPSGTTSPIASVHSSDSGALSLIAWQEGSYQLRMSDGKHQTVKVSDIPSSVQLEGPWEVKFPGGWGAPEQVTFKNLMSWTEHSHPDIKHFSGTATYAKNFNVSKQQLRKDKTLFLDLGEVKNIAEITLNGKNMGLLWKPPFRIEVSDALRRGNNQLHVKITNLWPNRLIGDAAKPDMRPFNEEETDWGKGGPKDWNAWKELIEEEQKNGLYTKQTGRYTWATWKHYDKDDPLLESGWLGPVQILIAKRKNISV